MLVTLIPYFDENMKVSAYALSTQKENYLLNPGMLGTGQNDNAPVIEGLELINHLGIETLCSAQKIFVPVSNISVFSDIEGQCSAPSECLVILIDNTIPPVEMYLHRLRELKGHGYSLAIQKLPPSDFQNNWEILKLADYMLLDNDKFDVSKVNNFFSRFFPNITLCAANINTTDEYEWLSRNSCYSLFEGSFFRLPVTKGSSDIAPVKINYIELLNMINEPDFDLTKVADIIEHDIALSVSLLNKANHMTLRSEISSIKHAVAMIGQKDLKRWVNTAIVNQLCSDRPNEITRLSLIRAKFAENLAEGFGLASKSSELFLMGLFSVLDIILDKPMEEAVELLVISTEIKKALIGQESIFADVLGFIIQYETANWSEVSRIMLLRGIATQNVYDAYIDALVWYRELFFDADK